MDKASKYGFQRDFNDTKTEGNLRRTQTPIVQTRVSKTGISTLENKQVRGFLMWQKSMWIDIFRVIHRTIYRDPMAAESRDQVTKALEKDRAK